MTKLISGHQEQSRAIKGNQWQSRSIKGTHLPGEPSKGFLVERATVTLAVTSLGFQSQSLGALRRQLCLECLNLACRLLEIV